MEKRLKINKKRNSGITIVALVITIVIMLILAGVTIQGITSDNGLIGRTKGTKKLAEIDSEKEEISLATVNAMGEGKNGSLEEKKLQESLKNKIGEGQTELIKDDKNFVVKIEKSKRYYRIDEAGNVEGPIEIIIDEMPGDITKGNKDAGKTEENPYIINCIEDLVAVSIATNGGNTDLEIEMKNGDKMKGIQRSNYNGKYIALNRTLDFNSELSYTNPERTDFGDINQDGKIENIKTELTSKEGRGFIPINNYSGTFDGKENEIRNLYEDTTNLEGSVTVGLFNGVGKILIKNLGVTGSLKGNWFAGGIVANAEGITIENCYNKADITGATMVGGIIGSSNGKFSIIKCKNYGNITISGSSWSAAGAGGISGSGKGRQNSIGTVVECENYGEVKGNYFCAGILGTAEYMNINGCKNYGNITTTNKNKSAGGIVGWHNYAPVDIINCSNNKMILSDLSAGGIVGHSAGASIANDLLLNIKNCYNTGELVSNNQCGGIIGNQGVTCKTNYINIENCYNIGKSNSTKYGAIMGTIYTSTRTETKTNLVNVYYLSSVANSGIISGTYTGEIESKDEEYMKSKLFVDQLNQNIGENSDWSKWKQGKNGYPEFE